MNVDPRKAAASSYTSLTIQHRHRPRPGSQSTMDFFFEKGDRKMWACFLFLWSPRCWESKTPLSITTVMKVLDGSCATESESVAMTPRDVSIHAPVVCFFSLKLLILLRLDGIKYPPFVIRVFNSEPISFNLQIPQQSSNQLCSSPKMAVVSPPPASHIRGCKSELLLGSAILQEGFFMFSPSSKCENVGNVLKNTRSQR